MLKRISLTNSQVCLSINVGIVGCNISRNISSILNILKEKIITLLIFLAGETNQQDGNIFQSDKHEDHV